MKDEIRFWVTTALQIAVPVVLIVFFVAAALDGSLRHYGNHAAHAIADLWAITPDWTKTALLVVALLKIRSIVTAIGRLIFT